jgi:hypothetical protein
VPEPPELPELPPDEEQAAATTTLSKPMQLAASRGMRLSFIWIPRFGFVLVQSARGAVNVRVGSWLAAEFGAPFFQEGTDAFVRVRRLGHRSDDLGLLAHVRFQRVVPRIPDERPGPP